MQARTILAGCALASFLACVLNYMSPVFLVLVPISLIATIAVLVSIYYKWKRGIEIFIFLSVTLFVIELVVFIVVLATRAEILRFYEMLMYLVGMLVCTASTATAIWVLNQTDYQRAGAERKSLISRFSDFKGKGKVASEKKEVTAGLKKSDSLLDRLKGRTDSA